MHDARPQVLRTELPTPDVVVVRNADGRILIIADSRLSQHVIDAAIDDLDTILHSRPHALG